MALVTLAAPAQFQITQEPTPWDKLIPNNIKITGQVVNNKPAAAQPARAGQATHQVNFMLDFNAEAQDAYAILLVNQDGMITNRNIGIRNLQQGSNNATVPEGTYDMVTIFREYQYKGTEVQELHHYLYVIHEQVTIDQDMQLDFSATEAKNHIHFQMFNNDGEPVVCPSYSRSEDWQMTMIDPGNTQYASYKNMIFCQEYGEVISAAMSSYYSTVQVADYLIDYQSQTDFYVNDVSDRYAFGSYCMIFDYDFNFLTFYKEAQGASSDVTLANDPSKFKLYENQLELPQDTEQEIEDRITMMLFNDASGFSIQTLQILNNTIEETGTARFYIGASADESAVGYVPFVVRNQLLVTLIYDEWSYMPFESYVIQTTPITCINDNVVLANFGNDFDNGRIDDLDNEWDEGEQTMKMYPYWPSHPAFTYPVDKKKGKWGNSCPILITNPRQYTMVDGWVDNELKYQYRGRYGEITSDHRRNAQVTMNLDGECIYDGPGFLEEHHFEEYYTSMNFLARFNEMFNGVVDATITNEAIKVDDLTGSNKAQLHYTAGAEDETPPTMTMLHFKNNNGDVTDRFAIAEDGTVEFSAADFNFFYTPNGDCSYFRHAPETVQVEYAPYGTDNWNELTVEEVPEYYWPIWGWCYRGSLAGVTGEAYQGWFDIKFRLEDAAGNWQEQVVSPAFRIDNLAYSSVATITPGECRDNAIYNLAGQRMRGDLSSLPRGVYISGGKKVVIN